MELRRDAALLLDMVGINVEKLLYVDDDVVTKHLLPPSSSGALYIQFLTSLNLRNVIIPVYVLNKANKHNLDYQKISNVFLPNSKVSRL